VAENRKGTYKEDELAGLVELLKANPVLGVDGLLLHGKHALDVANLVVAEPLAGLGHNRHIILESETEAQLIALNIAKVTVIILDQHKVVEGDEIVLVGLVLHLALVVDVSKEGVVGQVLLTRHTGRSKQMYISSRKPTHLIVKRGAEVLGLHRQIAHILVIHSEQKPKSTVSDIFACKCSINADIPLAEKLVHKQTHSVVQTGALGDVRNTCRQYIPVR
jgi:hypothetical protein